MKNKVRKDKIAQQLGRRGGLVKSERKHQANIESLKLARAARRRRYPPCPNYKNHAHRFIRDKCPCGLRRCPLCGSSDREDINCPNAFLFHVERSTATK